MHVQFQSSFHCFLVFVHSETVFTACCFMQVMVQYNFVLSEMLLLNEVHDRPRTRTLKPA
jgi:hypothetical protein